MRRFVGAFVLMMAAVLARGVAPETGKAYLKELVRVPLAVPALDWDFDPGLGFVLFASQPSSSEAMADWTEKLHESPQDAAAYFNLAQAQAAAGLGEKASQNFAQAKRIAAQRVELEPGNLEARVVLGQADRGLGDWPAAEGAFHEATLNLASNARAWLELGRFLQRKAERKLWSQTRIPFQARSGRVAFSRNPLTSEQSAEIASALEEAGNCLERARSLAGHESEVQYETVLGNIYANFLNRLLEAAEDRPFEAAAVLDSLFSERVCGQIENAARAEPQNVLLSANAAVFEALSWSPKRGWPASLNWGALPEHVRSSILERITAMEDFAQNAEAKAGARALQQAALLEAALVGDFAGAADTLERALRLDPERARTRELLIFCLNHERAFDRLLEICEEWVRQKPTVHRLSLLAEAEARLNLLDKAQVTLDQALSLDENDFQANLAASAILLKRGDNPIYALGAGLYLAKAEKASKSRQDTIDLALLKSLYQAFQNNLPEARRLLKQVLQLDSENEYAQQILTALH